MKPRVRSIGDRPVACTMRARIPVSIVRTIEADDEQAEPGDDLRQQRVVHVRIELA